ncbi:MAG: Rrf2 family transcriptional regulator [Zetaproteobacteria bacterium]|nr:MAG: Rrf2 family transcriptional regulator [Zetaproteobacteria bacterium]
MQLTMHTDYALRALVYLASTPGHRSTAEQIARAMSASFHHTMKVVHRLATEGFVRTIPGRGGGVALARPPEAIRVGEVVRAIEPLKLLACFDAENPGECPLVPACTLRNALGRAMQAFLRELDAITIADLLTENERMLLAAREKPET